MILPNLNSRLEFPQFSQPHSSVNLMRNGYASAVKTKSPESPNDFLDIGESLSSIPNIGETLKEFSQFVADLKSAKDEFSRKMILMTYFYPEYANMIPTKCP